MKQTKVGSRTFRQGVKPGLRTFVLRTLCTRLTTEMGFGNRPRPDLSSNLCSPTILALWVFFFGGGGVLAFLLPFPVVINYTCLEGRTLPVQSPQAKSKNIRKCQMVLQVAGPQLVAESGTRWVNQALDSLSERSANPHTVFWLSLPKLTSDKLTMVHEIVT